MTETLTDVSGLVESAFDKLDCISEADIPCEGNPAAFMVFHDCAEGYFCHAHYQYHIHVHRPTIKADLAEYGNMLCGMCRKRFESVEAWVQVYPL